MRAIPFKRCSYICLTYIYFGGPVNEQVLISLLDRLSDPEDLPIMVDKILSNLRASVEEKPSLRLDVIFHQGKFDIHIILAVSSSVA
jgi:hypothetical protein